jgi:hypothetical protein
MGGCFGLRTNGQVICWVHDTPNSVRLVEDPRIRNMALFLGSKKYPAIRSLVPARPPEAIECAHCKGTGELPHKVVCYCGGLGWLPSHSDRRNLQQVDTLPVAHLIQKTPSGRLALGLVVGGLAMGCCIVPGPGPPFLLSEITVIAMCCWGIAMTVGLGVSVASIRRGPASGRTAAFLAFAISLLCICGVAIQLWSLWRR